MAIGKAVDAAQTASKESASEFIGVTSTENTSRSQHASTPLDVESIHAGRRRRPGRNWICSQCSRAFEISCDPNQVPRKWWMPSNSAGGKAPWACPNCGTSELTFPVE